MKITQRNITVRELTDGYADNGDDGVVGFGGKLDIRPPYQREFVYGEKQREDVINTTIKGFPLNVMYWAKREDGTFEIMDGQQRTISLCQYVHSKFSREYRFFHNLTDDEKKAILDYEITVYICDGEASEKLDWFQTINIAGEKLTEQEIRNASYYGTWLTDAKKYLSRPNCAGYNIANQYISGKLIRQDYLETALKWVATRDNCDIKDYMGLYQHKPNANDLWLYFRSIIDWIKVVYPNPRAEMKSVDWGKLYAAHHADPLDGAALEVRVSELMMDEDITKKAGIYAYLLDGNENHLSIRQFSAKQKREAFERQGGVCVACSGVFAIDKMQADHITPWSKGGTTTSDNCQMLCDDCNRRKSNK